MEQKSDAHVLVLRSLTSNHNMENDSGSIVIIALCFPYVH